MKSSMLVLSLALPGLVHAQAAPGSEPRAACALVAYALRLGPAPMCVAGPVRIHGDSDGLCDSLGAGGADGDGLCDDYDARADAPGGGGDNDGLCDDIDLIARGGLDACGALESDSDGLCDALRRWIPAVCDGSDGQAAECEKLIAGVVEVCDSLDNEG